jgi:hypothetical protein
LRFLEKVSLGICIELYQLIYLNIPDLEQRIFQQTDTIFIEMEIPEYNSDTIFFKIEITYFSILAHGCYIILTLILILIWFQDFSNESELVPYIKPSIVIQVGSRQIGVIGYVTTGLIS